MSEHQGNPGHEEMKNGPRRDGDQGFQDKEQGFREEEQGFNEGLMRTFFHATALMHRYHHHIRRDREHGGNPHRGQGRVLALLKLKPEITQKELTFLLNMRNQSLGELLVKLERSGYIERTPSETDRRVMNVKLTEAGAEAAEQAEQNQQDDGKLFESFTEEEREQFGGYLDRLIAELEKQMEGEGFAGRDPRAFWGREGGPRPPFGPGGRGGFGPGGGRFRFGGMKGGRHGHGPGHFRGFDFPDSRQSGPDRNSGQERD